MQKSEILKQLASGRRREGSGPVDRTTDAGQAEGAFEVSTVDGFQGREKEVIVFSTVRSNAQGRLGFLADSRRMCVALTRAKRGLVVIGNAETLCSSRLWNAWMLWVKGSGDTSLCVHDV